MKKNLIKMWPPTLLFPEKGSSLYNTFIWFGELSFILCTEPYAKSHFGELSFILFTQPYAKSHVIFYVHESANIYKNLRFLCSDLIRENQLLSKYQKVTITIIIIREY